MPFWAKKGICGIDIRRQTFMIAASYVGLAIIAMIYGFFIIERPERLLPPEETTLIANETKQEIDVAESKDEAEAVENGEIASTEMSHYDRLLRKLQDEGVEIVLGALVTLVFSAMLAFGAKKSKSVWFMPWLIQQSVELAIGVGLFLVYAIAGHKYSAEQVVAFIISVFLAAYFLYAVMSHYLLLRTMDKHSRQVINSVMGEGQYSNAVDYRQIQEAYNANAQNNPTTTTTTSNVDDNSSSIPRAPIRERPTEANPRHGDIMYFSLE